MNVYKSQDIRNVVLLGHGSCGKTTLMEGMALLGGVVSRMGTVASGNTISDFDKEEQKRGFSLSASVLPLEWAGQKINVIDTPGYFDFVGEVEQGLSAAAAAVIVVSGKDGVQTGTLKAWEACEKLNLPRMIFVTEMDLADANFAKVGEQLKEAFGSRVAPVTIPIRENGKLVGYVNTIKNVARRYLGVGQREDMPIPDTIKASVEKARVDLMEAVAETDEEMMDRFFEAEVPSNAFTEEEVVTVLHKSVATSDFCPVYMGCGATAHGIFMLLNDIVSLITPPTEVEFTGTLDDGSEFVSTHDESKPKSLFIWKTMVDPFIGKYSMIKVKTGVLKADDAMVNQRTGNEEKIGKLYVLQGNKPIEVPELHAGDLGALAKLDDAKTGDTYA